MQKSLNGAMLKSMILTAAKLLEVNRANIDALNVFPVQTAIRERICR